MRGIKIQHSKDAFCDFLLTRLWQNWLTQNGHDIDRDFDLISENLDYVKDFMHYLEYISLSYDHELSQFGIKTPEDLQKQLKQSYENLTSNDIEF